MNKLYILKTLIHVMLTIISILYIVTGFGISNYQMIESLTGGTLSKLTSFRIHSNLIIPFIILFIAHIIFSIKEKFRKKNQS